MSSANEQLKAVITETEFVELYGNCQAVLQDGTVAEFTINDALKVEAIMCKGKPEKRQDPEARLKKLAKFIGDALQPEHRWLTAEEEK